MYWTNKKLRLACREALRQRGMSGELCMENRYNPYYSALFTVGQDLVLAAIENTNRAQLSIGLKKFSETA